MSSQNPSSSSAPAALRRDASHSSWLPLPVAHYTSLVPPSSFVAFPPALPPPAHSYASTTALPREPTVDDAMLGSKPPPKGRRTSGGAGEQVKHRRTRSGCFTCRQRRVKCDEARPICERCQKGNRACVYPEPTAPSSSRSGGSGSKKASAPEPASSGDDLDDEDEDVGLSTIVDEPEGDDPRVEHSGGQHQKKSVDSGKSKNVGQWKSRDDSAGQDKGSSPSTEASTPFSSAYSGSGHRATSSSDPSEPSPSIPDWSRLPADLQFYLDYHQSQLTHHHYFFKTNSDRFLRTVFLDQALRSEPLLYAVVGFAAYHHTLTRPDGKLQHFLKYYNKSITLLRLSLGKMVHSLANLLTILELATLEEYLGDWVNLLGHQKAAFELLTSLFTPQTIMESETRRIILAWYARFDVFAGLMAGHETVLGRDWFQSNQQHASELVRRNPEDVDLKYDEFFSKVRLTAMDMSILFARLKKGEIDPQIFIEQNNILTQRISDLRFAMDSVLFDQTYLIKDMSYAGMGDPEDIVDPYVPGLLFGGQLWTTNFLLLDWYSLDLMHTYQTSLALQMPPPPKLTELALKICQMFEAIQLFPESQGGGVLGAQAPVAIATLFLPKDYRHTMWCRRKFALVESLGYIYPITFRQKMSEVWGLPEVIHWWLPNNEGYPEIVRSMRQFVEDRITAPKDQAGEDLRDIKNIFRDMSLGDSPNKSSSGSPGDSMGSSLPDMQPGSFSAPSMGGEQSQSFDELLMHGEVPAYWDFTHSSTNNNPYGSHGPP